MDSEDSSWPPKEPASGREFVRALLRRGREYAAKTKEAVEAVRIRGRDEPRDVRRTMLEDEFRKRNLPTDPIAIEQQLDKLEWSRAQQAAKVGEILVGLAGLGRRSLGKQSADVTPEWMRLPAEAEVDVCSPLVGAPVSSKKSAVLLDPDSGPVLQRVLAESPKRVAHLATVEVWFDDVEDDQGVAVFVGRHLVGTVADDALPAVGNSVRRAAEQAQKPKAHAVLAKAEHLAPPYLLVVNVPTAE